MSLRDYFAAKAMLALLTHHGGYTGDEAHQSSIPCLREDVLDVDSLAQYAYSQADAMLAEGEEMTIDTNEAAPVLEPVSL